MRSVGKILEIAEGVRRVGFGWLASCPIPNHGQGRGDRNAILSVCEGDDGPALVRCKLGREAEAIVAARSLSIEDRSAVATSVSVVVPPDRAQTARKRSSVPCATALHRCTLEEYAEAKRLPVGSLWQNNGLVFPTTTGTVSTTLLGRNFRPSGCTTSGTLALQYFSWQASIPGSRRRRSDTSTSRSRWAPTATW
jgi:hypothetical protein